MFPTLFAAVISAPAHAQAAPLSPAEAAFLTEARGIAMGYMAGADPKVALTVAQSSQLMRAIARAGMDAFRAGVTLHRILPLVSRAVYEAAAFVGLSTTSARFASVLNSMSLRLAAMWEAILAGMIHLGGALPSIPLYIDVGQLDYLQPQELPLAVIHDLYQDFDWNQATAMYVVDYGYTADGYGYGYGSADGYGYGGDGYDDGSAEGSTGGTASTGGGGGGGTSDQPENIRHDSTEAEDGRWVSTNLGCFPPMPPLPEFVMADIPDGAPDTYALPVDLTDIAQSCEGAVSLVDPMLVEMPNGLRADALYAPQGVLLLPTGGADSISHPVYLVVDALL